MRDYFEMIIITSFARHLGNACFPQAVERLEQVYSFDKKCVDAAMSLIGTTAVTQDP